MLLTTEFATEIGCTGREVVSVVKLDKVDFVNGLANGETFCGDADVTVLCARGKLDEDSGRIGVSGNVDTTKDEVTTATTIACW